MANLTLTIDDQTLRRARIRALEEGTSVNAVVREYLGTYVQSDGVEAAIESFIEAGRQSRSGSGEDGRTWARGDLYEDREPGSA